MELKIFNIIEYENTFYNDLSFLFFYISINYEANERKQQQLAKYLNVTKLSKPQIELYKNLEYLSIEYIYFDEKSNKYFYGNCLIPSIQDIINGSPFSTKIKRDEHLRDFLWDNIDEVDYTEKIKNAIIIDYINQNSNTFTIGKMEKGELKLYLCLYPNYVLPLKIDIIEYVKMCDEFRGSYGWHFHFIDVSRLNEKELDYLSKIRTENVRDKIVQTFRSEADVSELSDIEFSNANDIEVCYSENYFLLITDSFERLKNKVEKKGHYNLETALLECPKPLDIYSINKVEHILKRKLPNELLNFYLQYNGFTLEWKDDSIKIDGYSPKSNFEIVPFQEVFGGRNSENNRHWGPNKYEGSVVMSEIMDNETLAIARECYPILFSEFIDVVMKIPDFGEIELYGIIKGEYTRLNISFENFIKLIIRLCGIDFWYILLPEYKHLQVEEHFPAIDKFIVELFPEVDFL
ncbi:hypothetical protein [Kordia sp.]|uniref:hypothetical protein n=1 Tax=Kordia sp. TaxID=1965332 RepID=UPI003B59280E